MQRFSVSRICYFLPYLLSLILAIPTSAHVAREAEPLACTISKPPNNQQGLKWAVNAMCSHIPSGVQIRGKCDEGFSEWFSDAGVTHTFYVGIFTVDCFPTLEIRVIDSSSNNCSVFSNDLGIGAEGRGGKYQLTVDCPRLSAGIAVRGIWNSPWYSSSPKTEWIKTPGVYRGPTEFFTGDPWSTDIEWAVA
ncbi:hypothetical protein PV10_02378 [Exophiala mesophila]|uniref:Ecp2 effector protein domain-containing protein n=1 Tax=Exophiala mesophila TaxID=212818 RepID=A0A0D1ZJ52_EXOME|nr:uncharacterized protein PV10_02378 [Exophiala mesophila]KIV94627.1 hypothetical protein PV10_02378 [Exophiala mesophila]